MDRSILLALLTLIAVLPAQAQGGCAPPIASFSGPSATPIRICQGDELVFDASESEAAEGQVIVQWIWSIHGSRDTTAFNTANHLFSEPGVFEVTLEVVDDIGCSSGETAPIHILVSGSPDFEGTTVPSQACEGDEFILQAFAEQPPMIGYPIACTAPDNPVPLIDTPTPPSTSSLLVAGQSTAPLASLAELGDICLDIEHSYMGDLMLMVTCPNGQSVVLHDQGGGSIFLGDANDDKSGIPGECFRYCFGLAPEFGTMEASAFDNFIPVGDRFALAPGRYTSVQPLEQLLGCPMNGTWTFSSTDNFGADDGYLCGWCISFGETPDSSFIDQGPTLGTSADSSFWSGTGVSNTSGSPGQGALLAIPGEHTIDYTVLDDYGCEHLVSFPFSVGDVPEPAIINNTELGLLCAQPTGAGYTYQWSYAGQPVVGAEGVCFTPPGSAAVSVEVTTPQGCSGSTTLLNTGILANSTSNAPILIQPTVNSGRFTITLSETLAGPMRVQLLDALGRSVFQEVSLGAGPSISLDLVGRLPAGAYSVLVQRSGSRAVGRMVVE
ncbi:MAG TPA: PKD domain-containing protein [Flavobacteriales bacterium]|mgnify:CR=1 FL=1|nr:PKD domain-containing protein [Flavobacteriales bacterium]